MKKYNTTQLNPETTFERHVFHRDQFAHYLRWTHVLKLARIGQNVLDVGCGSGNLFEVFYRNRFKPKNYTGIDVRPKTIEAVKKKFKMCQNATWLVQDICKPYNLGKKWDIITSFEVMEHISKENANAFLENITNHCNEDTTVLISTPVYDEKVGAAKNHIINGKVCEFGFDELKEILKKYFNIEKVYGTFASQRDYKPQMSKEELEMFEKLSEYYDVNLVANIFAPLFPEYSRNCIWKLKLKK